MKTNKPENPFQTTYDLAKLANNIAKVYKVAKIATLFKFLHIYFKLLKLLETLKLFMALQSAEAEFAPTFKSGFLRKPT